MIPRPDQRSQWRVRPPTAGEPAILSRDPAYRKRAGFLGARIRDEDGAAPVLEAMDRLDG
ncbi:hypothetical protein ABZ079_12680 [Streptomyces sp. NPDC006314]|uniref:hypothetical protein n=1 Tax=Streptomyces sp. NPDC006314 TaxID=3154475 RepID=UPI0033A874A0